MALRQWDEAEYGEDATRRVTLGHGAGHWRVCPKHAAALMDRARARNPEWDLLDRPLRL